MRNPFNITKIFKIFLSYSKKIFFSNRIGSCETIADVAIHIIAKSRQTNFTFLEIGVFKGDNAVHVAQTILNKYRVKFKYIGFDLFDDIDQLKDKYPDDFKQYNLKDYPYWEFNSGGHNYQNVMKKLSTIFQHDEFKLYKGDTTKTLPQYLNTFQEQIDLIYIDGCHDYLVVNSDWQNCSKLFEKNKNLVVIFDDISYDGVRQVYNEIKLQPFFKTLEINKNQFLVYSKNSYL